MFNVTKFQQASFTAREASVKVPGLKDFFEEGAEPVFKVRGLTGSELAAANEAKERNRNLVALAEALVSGGESEKAEAIKGMLGLGGNVPDDIARRISMIVSASVEPVIDHETAVKLSESFPVEFYALTNKILELTGEGAELGKRKRSTPVQTSG